MSKQAVAVTLSLIAAMVLTLWLHFRTWPRVYHSVVDRPDTIQLPDAPIFAPPHLSEDYEFPEDDEDYPTPSDYEPADEDRDGPESRSTETEDRDIYFL